MDGDERAIGREATQVDVGVRRDMRMVDWGAGVGAVRVARGMERGARRALGGRGSARTRARRGILRVVPVRLFTRCSTLIGCVCFLALIVSFAELDCGFAGILLFLLETRKVEESEVSKRGRNPN